MQCLRGASMACEIPEATTPDRISIRRRVKNSAVEHPRGQGTYPSSSNHTAALDRLCPKLFSSSTRRRPFGQGTLPRAVNEASPAVGSQDATANLVPEMSCRLLVGRMPRTGEPVRVSSGRRPPQRLAVYRRRGHHAVRLAGLPPTSPDGRALETVRIDFPGCRLTKGVRQGVRIGDADE